MNDRDREIALVLLRELKLSAARAVRDWIAAERRDDEPEVAAARVWIRDNLDDAALLRIVETGRNSAA